MASEVEKIEWTHGPEIGQHTLHQQANLEAIVAELSDEQRRVLSLLRQGATYRQIADVLSMNDKSALRVIAPLLCELADKVAGIPDDVSRRG